jgi:hypothetical protein
MLLGDILANVERAGADGTAAALLNDLPLMARLAAADVEPDAYILSAIRRFERHASSDDWVSLMGAASGSADPGAACLKRIVEWALKADTH